MSTGRRWQDVKAEAHRLHPELANPERQAKARAELDAYVAGHHLKELRKSLGKTQTEIAQVLGVSQYRISQIVTATSRPWN
jgi:DNA-binding transcriptional regulator YiaG